MKKLISIILLFGGSHLTLSAQTSDSTDAFDWVTRHFQYNTMEYKAVKNESWAKNTGTKTFDYQSLWTSLYIGLNSDSSFVFLSFYEPGEFLTVGNWTKSNDSTITLNWNKEQSFATCKYPRRYKRYCKVCSPMPIKINHWVFILRQNKLIPVAERTKG